MDAPESGCTVVTPRTIWPLRYVRLKARTIKRKNPFDAIGNNPNLSLVRLKARTIKLMFRCGMTAFQNRMRRAHDKLCS